MAMLTEWSAGRPAAAGWYVASTERDINARRWWDGRRWSAPVRWDDLNRQCPRYASTDRRENYGERARSTPARLDRGDRIEWRGRAACWPLLHA